MTTIRRIIKHDCTGPNKACRAAARRGLTVHVIPESSDDQPLLVMHSYHFASEGDANTAVEDAMRTAPLVTNDDELYRFRSAGRPYKVPRGFVDPSRRFQIFDTREPEGDGGPLRDTDGRPLMFHTLALAQQYVRDEGIELERVVIALPAD